MINNANFDLYIEESTDFSMYITLENVELDEYGKETTSYVDLTQVSSVVAQVRADYDTNKPAILTFDAAVSNALGGEISLGLSAADTANLIYDDNSPTIHIGYYDVIVVATTGTKAKLVGGKVFLNQTVTR